MRIFLIYLWTFPTTCVGLIFLLPAWMSGGEVARVDGVIEISGGAVKWFLKYCTMLPGGARAMTLGHVVIGVDIEQLAATRAHERIHVKQAQRWGPLFIPAYLLCSLWLMLRQRDAYFENPFEREAFEKS